ncbi:MAG TPA: restriction endonuclease subunit S [Thermoanaerobaculia bacterium]|nr:restriction endonuclease subunit S [Thermoanaerobaculia bacterium]
MKETLVPSSWLEKEGRRLDSGPYLSGAIEARRSIEKLRVPKHCLHTLTKGHNGGIFNGPQFVRRYVSEPAHGVRFLTSSSMLIADLAQADLLRKTDALSPKLTHLRIEEGMTLISCSGTIGNMVYARPELVGVWSSQDILKIVPDPDKVRPGYVYAFLASRFGIPLVVGGTYGAIIRHIEPQHVWDLPVPRLDPAVEEECHRLVSVAGAQRTRASELLREARERLDEIWGLSTVKALAVQPPRGPDVVILPASKLQGRFDAFFHGTAALEADRVIFEIGSRIPIRTLGECALRVFETPRFGRISIENPRHGIPFMSIADLARIDPVSDDYISKRQVVDMDAEVAAGWLVLPRVGQLQGLFGHVVCIPPHLHGTAVSDNNIRIVPHNREDSGYLFAALSSDICYRQIVRRACGTSIPYLDSPRVCQIPVPWPEDQTNRARVAIKVNEAMDLRSEAVRGERLAVSTVEKAIAKGLA